MKKILLDVATPKHAIFAYYLKPLYEKEGFKVDIVARENTQTLDMLNYFNLKYKVLGGYGGADLLEKYQATLDNEVSFLNYFLKYGYPDIIWSHGNVAGIRSAFHLGIPVIHVNDTPYNVPVAKLTVPLSTRLISPSAWSKRDWVRYGIDPGDVILYYGLEEVSWVKRLAVDKEEVQKRYLGKVVDRLIVFRMVEYKASYSLNAKPNIEKIISKLTHLGTVYYIPRYKEELDRIKKMKIDNLVIADKPIFAPEILATADLNINSGGTMARESALLGIPTISYYFYNKITRFLIRHRLPIWYITEPDRILRKAYKILREPDKYKLDTRDILMKFDDPLSVIVKTTLDTI